MNTPLRWVGLLALVLPAWGCKPKSTESPSGDLGSGISSIDAGRRFTMVLYKDGHVRMLGNPFAPRDTRVWNVGFGDRVEQIAAGAGHACALLASAEVRCMGKPNWGALGYGNEEAVYDPEQAGAVDVGARVQTIAAGHAETCAVVEGGNLQCWGSGQGGRLGYGKRNDIGDSEPPKAAGAVSLGGKVAAVDLGFAGVACAVLEDGGLRCWGQAVQGALGYGRADDVGDDEVPADLGNVPLTTPAARVAVGNTHACALDQAGAVHCWGYGGLGRLGYANTANIGDETTAAQSGPVDVGGAAVQVAAGGAHTCALLQTGAVRCWGLGRGGRLGYANEKDIGDDETPASAGDIDLGGKAVQVSAGWDHTCALLETGDLRCWGLGVGDDEPPSAVPAIDLGSAQREPLSRSSSRQSK